MGYGVGFDVKGLVFDGWAGYLEMLFGLGKKACRDIREGILEPPVRQEREDSRRRRPGSRADFENPQPPIRGKSGHGGRHRISQHSIRGT